MQTTIDATGNPKTTINEGDRKALLRVQTIGRHLQANVPALKDIGGNAVNDVGHILRHFDKPTT